MKNILNLILPLLTISFSAMTLFASGGGGPGGGDLIYDEELGKKVLVDFWINKKIRLVNFKRLKGYEFTAQQLEAIRAKVPGFADALEQCGQNKKWILTNRRLDQGTLNAPVEISKRDRLARQNKFEIRIDLSEYTDVSDEVAGDTWFHEQIRCVGQEVGQGGNDDESIQDMNMDLHDDRLSEEDLRQSISRHKLGWFKTATEVESDKQFAIKQNFDYQESLQAKQEFINVFKSINSVCVNALGKADGILDNYDVNTLQKVLEILKDAAINFEQKGINGDHTVSRTRRQKFYYNMGKYLAYVVSAELSGFSNSKIVPADAKASWEDSRIMPKFSSPSADKVKYLHGWRICANYSYRSDDTPFYIYNALEYTGFHALGRPYVHEGLDQKTILQLQDPELK